MAFQLCNSIFKPLGMSLDEPTYPTCCTNWPFPGDDLYDMLLLHDSNDGHSIPIKSFIYHHFHDYMASLLAKPRFEDSGSLEGLCAGALFVDCQGEGHLLFSLNVDFFNIEGNWQWNAMTSCGIISCACLNLLLHIQYKPENLYLANIVPGPTKPSGDQLNPFLEPLINDLVDSWKKGVQVTQTASQRDCITCSAIACVVCDLPAARKSAQLAGITSHFYCSACHCGHTSSLGHTDVDSEYWQFHSKVMLQNHGVQYRDTKSQKEWNKLFSAHGVRWSPLWCLPYWDPAQQLVIDSMHCVLKGLAQAQFCEHLGLTTTFATKAQSEAELWPVFSYPFCSLDSLSWSNDALEEWLCPHQKYSNPY